MKLFQLSLLCLTLLGCSDFFFGRTLEGKVTQNGSRLKIGDKGAQQKISLIVSATKTDPTMEEVAGGPSGVVIECTSTRCASITLKTCHRFKCKHNRFKCKHKHNFTQPDIIECKHAKEIKCLE